MHSAQDAWYICKVMLIVSHKTLNGNLDIGLFAVKYCINLHTCLSVYRIRAYRGSL